MVISSIIKHLLNDDESLLSYANGQYVGINDVKRRLFLKERSENITIPDHHYRLIAEKTFKGISTLNEVIRIGISGIGREYLELKGDRIYVQAKKQNQWQQLITYIPPLIVQCAFLQEERPLQGSTYANFIDYFQRIILPNTKYTCLPSPDIQQLNLYMKSKYGLYDLHMHLNGSTEVDQAWQDYLFNPEKIYKELSNAFALGKVKEQLEQESRLLSPYRFNQLLYTARQIRMYLSDYIFASTGSDKRLNENIDKLLRGAVDKDNVGKSQFHPFSYPLKITDHDYPHLMSIEAFMYILVFRSLAQSESEKLSSLFHFYLLILGLSNRLLVQQTHQYGFEQFQKLTLNGLRETSEKEYRQRFFQMQGNDLGNISLLEGRFSPKSSEEDTFELLDEIEKGWTKLRESVHTQLSQENSRIRVDKPELKLVAHFIKKADNERGRIRHRLLRTEIWEKATVLALVIQNYPSLLKKITGIDAASSEFDTPPEVFGPVFRYMRRMGIKHFTYHAGEDFHHIIRGLRAIFEAINFTCLQSTDRIGHATATGIAASQWASLIGTEMLIRRGEWLDNLIFTYYLISSRNIEMLKDKLPVISIRIQELSVHIYGEPYLPEFLGDCWLLRKYCPILWFCSDISEAQTKSVFNLEEWAEITEMKRRYNRHDEFLSKYHYNRDLYDEIMSINSTELFDVEEIEQVQLEILKMMHEKEIVIETLPTSNVRIGIHKDYSTYQLWNWIEWKNDHSIPPIVLGTDDTGIFATNIYNEYANIYCELTNGRGIAEYDALEIIKNLDENGRKYSFLI